MISTVNWTYLVAITEQGWGRETGQENTRHWPESSLGFCVDTGQDTEQMRESRVPFVCPVRTPGPDRTLTFNAASSFLLENTLGLILYCFTHPRRRLCQTDERDELETGRKRAKLEGQSFDPVTHLDTPSRERPGRALWCTMQEKNDRDLFCSNKMHPSVPLSVTGPTGVNLNNKQIFQREAASMKCTCHSELCVYTRTGRQGTFYG
jgi:hypothetical protein